MRGETPANDQTDSVGSGIPGGEQRDHSGCLSWQEASPTFFDGLIGQLTKVIGPLEKLIHKEIEEIEKKQKVFK